MFRETQGDSGRLRDTRITIIVRLKKILYLINYRPARLTDINKVLIQDDQTDNRCWSYVGNQQNGIQLLELSNWCFNNRTVPHELLHAAGMYHEHNRPDRDQYIQVNLNCVEPGTENNYEKQKSSLTYGLPYNHKSIMHYSSGPSSCRYITSTVHMFCLNLNNCNINMTEIFNPKVFMLFIFVGKRSI